MVVFELSADKTFFLIQRRIKFKDSPDRFYDIGLIELVNSGPVLVINEPVRLDALEVQAIANKVNLIIYLNYRKLADQEK